MSLPACISQMDDVSALISELQSLKDLVAAQVAVGIEERETLASLFNSWKLRLASLSLDVASQCEITLAVSSGPWSQEQKKELGRLLVCTPSKNSPKGRTAMHTRIHFENFINEEMWAKIRTTRSRAFIVNMIALQARLLNLTCPPEPTLYRMTAIVAYAMNNYDMSQQDVFSIMDALQVAIKAKASKPLPVALPHLVEFPSFASLLLDGMKAYVYQGSVLVGVDVPDLDTILGGSRQRGRKHFEWLKHVPKEYHDLLHATLHGKQNDMSSPHERRKSLMSRGSSSSCGLSLASADDTHLRLELLGNGASRHPEGVGVTTLARALAHTPQVKAISDAAVPVEDGPPEKVDCAADVSDVAADGAVAAMEAALLAAASARRAGKSKDPGEAKAVASMKRPAGAAASLVAKRPACSVAGGRPDVDMSDVFAGLRRDHAKLNRGSFTSRAYDAAKRRALAAGCSKERSTEIAKAYFAKAASLWNDLGH